MKNSILSLRSLLSVCLCLCLSAAVHAQDKKVSVDLRNAPLRELFKSIEGQSSYNFSYRDSEINGITVTLKADNTSVSEILAKHLPKHNLSYTFANGRIVVTPAGDTPPSLN